MKPLFATAIVACGIACVAAPPALFAQQKTAKECREEWRANKDANKKAGVTEKDYVAKCRGEAAAATSPAAPTAPHPSAAPARHAKTAQQGRDATPPHKHAHNKAGVTEKDYVANGRGEAAAAPSPATPAPPAAAPAQAPSTTTARPAPSAAAPPAPAPAAPPATQSKQAPTAAAPSGANQFANEAQ